MIEYDKLSTNNSEEKKGGKKRNLFLGGHALFLFN